MRVLLVEDEPMLAVPLSRGLREEGYAVDVAATAGEAEDAVSGVDYDLVILDRRLPDGDGVALLRRWRQHGASTPVLVLTAMEETLQKVEGLDAGADDYLTKPFAYEELLARLRSLLRRPAAAPTAVLQLYDLVLDRNTRTARRGGRPLDLTGKEIALLEYLMLWPGHVRSRLDIAEHVWDEAYEARTNVIDVILGRLRKKMEAGGEPRIIFTVKGLGYVLRRE
ncbi:MAG: response regulator transcription factor [Candidatus Schekmanbacteria bacterium]|nr:response regulator transcription factor [Candidatus Schekmanbacteria bacterium]